MNKIQSVNYKLLKKAWNYMKKLLGKEKFEIFIDVKAIFYWNYNFSFCYYFKYYNSVSRIKDMV